MTESQHTPKKWQIKMSITGPSKSKLEVNGAIGTEAKDAIVKVLDLDFKDARRLVACWNACEGVPTDALERSKSLPDFVLAGQAIERQRDELLKALRELADSFDPQTTFSELEKARAALRESLEATSWQKPQPASEDAVYAAIKGVDSLNALAVWRTAEKYHCIIEKPSISFQ